MLYQIGSFNLNFLQILLSRFEIVFSFFSFKTEIFLNKPAANIPGSSTAVLKSATLGP